MAHVERRYEMKHKIEGVVKSEDKRRCFMFQYRLHVRANVFCSKTIIQLFLCRNVSEFCCRNTVVIVRRRRSRTAVSERPRSARLPTPLHLRGHVHPRDQAGGRVGERGVDGRRQRDELLSAADRAARDRRRSRRRWRTGRRPSLEVRVY